MSSPVGFHFLQQVIFIQRSLSSTRADAGNGGVDTCGNLSSYIDQASKFSPAQLAQSSQSSDHPSENITVQSHLGILPNGIAIHLGGVLVLKMLGLFIKILL
jgi:hypothetical protein